MEINLKNINPIAFENDIGQEINFGDDVVLVTSGRGNNVNISRGKYLGLKGDRVACLAKEKDYSKPPFYLHKKDGSDATAEVDALNREKRFRLEAADSLDKSAKYNIAAEYSKIFEDRFDKFYHEKLVRRSLILNRVYKLA